MAADDWKRDLSEIVFARMAIIGWTALTITAGAVAIALWYPPVYLATGSLILRSKTVQSSTESLNAPDVGAVPLAMGDLVSERQLLTSGTLIKRTLVQLQEQGKIERPSAALSQAKGGLISGAIKSVKQVLKRLSSIGKAETTDAASDPEMLDAISGIRDVLTANVVPDSTIINLTLQGQDARRVERFLDALISEHLKYRLDVLHPADQQLFYRERRDFYSERLKALERALTDVSDAASLGAIEAEIANNINLAMAMTQQQSTLRNQYIEQQQRTAMLTEALQKDTVSYFAFLDNVVLENLSQQLMTLSIERGRLVRQFRDGSPQLAALDANLASISGELKAEVQTIHTDAIQKQEALLAQTRLLGLQISELKDQTMELQSKAVKFRQISREAALLRISYESFARRNEEAEISRAVAASDVSGDITVLSRPEFSAVKIFPRLLLTPLLGLLIGLMTGCSAALVMEFFDHTIRRASDIAHFTSMPVLGSIRQVGSSRFQKRGSGRKTGKPAAARSPS